MHTAAAVLLLVVRTYNVFNVPARDLGVGARVSADILRRAGIEMIWINCAKASEPADPLCAGALESNEVMVRIVSAPRRPGPGIAAGALGYAYVDTAVGRGSLATVYADRIETMASASGLGAGTVLGRVMAHEIGHLLLGTNAHQPHGLMQAQWSPSLLQRRIERDWQFSRGDAERLDKNLALRGQTPDIEP